MNVANAIAIWEQKISDTNQERKTNTIIYNNDNNNKNYG